MTIFTQKILFLFSQFSVCLSVHWLAKKHLAWKETYKLSVELRRFYSEGGSNVNILRLFLRFGSNFWQAMRLFPHFFRANITLPSDTLQRLRIIFWEIWSSIEFRLWGRNSCSHLREVWSGCQKSKLKCNPKLLTLGRQLKSWQQIWHFFDIQMLSSNMQLIFIWERGTFYFIYCCTGSSVPTQQPRVCWVTDWPTL